MKINATKVISLNSRLLNSDFNKKNPIVFSAIIVSGIITGVLILSMDSRIFDNSNVKFNEFININVQRSFTEVFSGNLLYNLIYIVFPLLLGLSVAGFVLIYFVPFIKGLGIGAACALIYSSYGLKGIGYCLIIVFPVALIQFIAVILSCNESYQMSTELFSVLRKENTAEENGINLFLLRYFIILLITVIASILYAACNQIFFRIISV